MSIVKPFVALRPTPELAKEVACLPYDVMNREEAKQMARQQEHSFLHVVRSEIDLEGVDAYDQKVYEKASENLRKMVNDGILIRDQEPYFYLYYQEMEGRGQLGLVARTSIDEYESGHIKKHELTREVKLQDRMNNFYCTKANTAPIFLSYKKNEKIDSIMKQWIDDHDAIIDLTTEDGILHKVWVIDDKDKALAIEEAFLDQDALYIADGHHRTESGARIGRRLKEENGGKAGNYDYFLSVLFSDEQLHIMDYNRVVKDLNSLSEEQFLEEISKKFEVLKIKEAKKPSEKYHFTMILKNGVYELVAKEDIRSDDPVNGLDVSILQKNLLEPILGIGDPRTDERIDFVGGIRGIDGVKQRVDSGEMSVGFLLYPTSISDLMRIADHNLLMPPKSTWFEPKLRSGLFVYEL